MTSRQLSTVKRLQEWATGPTGRRLFAWGTEGDINRCALFFAGKIPDALLGEWCTNLAAAARS